MEERKIDINSIIGFVLIFAILLFMLWQNQPTPEELEAQEKAKQEKIDVENKAKEVQAKDDFVVTPEDLTIDTGSDSTKIQDLNSKYGAFAYSATLPSAKDEFTIVESDVLELKFNNKGGFLSEVRLKKFVNYDSVPIYLVRNNNTALNINFGSTDSRILNTKDLYFEPTVTKSGENTIVSMKLKGSPAKFLEYRYVIKPKDYMIDFSIQSQRLNDVINSSQEINLDWKLKGFRHDKSITYENRYTRLTYKHDGDRIDKLSPAGEDEELLNDVSWLSFRQHFFSSILVTDKPFKNVTASTEDLVKDEEIDTVFTKIFASKIPLELNGGELNEDLSLFFGPTDQKVLRRYKKNLEDAIPLGWGIFGWINRYLFIPLFAFLSSFLPYGIAIIVMTILIKLLMSFVQYKQFLSQAKLKILKPELDEIREKHKDNKMKAQQETMALQNKAGASPLEWLSTCVNSVTCILCIISVFPISF